jgi:hypothetical protein
VSFATTTHDWVVDASASFFGVLYLVRMRREGGGEYKEGVEFVF